MRWILLRFMTLVQDPLLNLLTSSPAQYHCAADVPFGQQELSLQLLILQFILQFDLMGTWTIYANPKPYYTFAKRRDLCWWWRVRGKCIFNFSVLPGLAVCYYYFGIKGYFNVIKCQTMTIGIERITDVHDEGCDDSILQKTRWLSTFQISQDTQWTFRLSLCLDWF